ncbi:imidazole glycerol phosphate synthase subunit HisF [Methanoregula formicica]|uniref:Imidazole glycerol phosphate synthase subunit HisF n=1 Tax=Methanoregula formicica (strain DSM 22288 / NBRC 105244 / SMSP) TaxID=593750 RepID=L0HEY9_METFS|nr:imidazole glycerol phosphate synthase cyclase subunit [Methanoregula formicica]AGB02351.1 imidazoleglycerol-phosphate synthase [Methanoregula formicica SMSP]
MPLRIIARLDVKPPDVVKPVHFEGLRRMGSPKDLASKYYNQGADEILFEDIVASLYRRPIMLDLIHQTSRDLYIPFAAGGGVQATEHFEQLLHNGVDKVLINTYALQEDPSIIRRAAEIFGSQAVVVHIVAKHWTDWWECYSDCGRIRSGKNAVSWAKEVESLGAGELLVSSVDRDGRNRGFDKDLIAAIVSKVKIPVIAGSGAGSLEEIRDMITHAKPDAVAIGSLLHYNKTTIGEIKTFLADSGIEVAL